MSTNPFPTRIIVLGAFGILLTFIPYFLPSMSTLTYDAMSSTIFVSAKSTVFTNILIFSLGCCFPILLEYFLDIATFGVMGEKAFGFFSRGIVLGTLWLPDIVFLLYIIPENRLEFWGPINAIRSILCICVAFYDIGFSGCEMLTEGKRDISLFICIIAMVIRSFTSILTYPILELISTIMSAIAVLSIILINICWFRTVRDTKLEEWTSTQYRSSTYAICILLLAAAMIIVRSIYGTITPNSNIETLVAYKCIHACFVLMVCISHSRIARKEMLYTQKKLETKRIFVRLVSHEIRTPLNIVVMGLKCIEKELSEYNTSLPIKMNDEIRRTLKETQASCDVAVEILNDLLAYEKLEAGIMTLEAKEIPIWPFIKEVLQPFALSAIESSVLLHFSHEDETENIFRNYILQADRSKLGQVLRNIMSNAIKFTPAGGTVTVSMSLVEDSNHSYRRRSSANQSVRGSGRGRDSINMNTAIGAVAALTHRVRIDVKDTGYGIAKENLSKLFKDIVQFDADKLQNGGGSGIGLWVSKALIDLHDGIISAESEGVGHGCTFTIELPVFLYTGTIAASRPLAAVGTHNTARLWSIDRATLQRIPEVIVDNNNNDVNDRLTLRYKDDRGGGVEEDNDDDEGGEGELSSAPPPLVDGNRDRDGERPPPSAAENNTVILLPTVLMVDDSTMSRKMTRRLVQGRFASILEAGNGQIAVDMVKKTMEGDINDDNDDNAMFFDLILMDYQMPIMDGPTASRLIREMGYKGKIIGITGNALPEDISYFISQGADAVLTKPLDMSILDTMISQLPPREIEDINANTNTATTSTLLQSVRQNTWVVGDFVRRVSIEYLDIERYS